MILKNFNFWSQRHLIKKMEKWEKLYLHILTQYRLKASLKVHLIWWDPTSWKNILHIKKSSTPHPGCCCGFILKVSKLISEIWNLNYGKLSFRHLFLQNINFYYQFCKFCHSTKIWFMRYILQIITQIIKYFSKNCIKSVLLM